MPSQEVVAAVIARLAGRETVTLGPATVIGPGSVAVLEEVRALRSRVGAVTADGTEMLEVAVDEAVT